MTEITLLDGSVGQELVKRSSDRPTPLWSTQVMIDHPDLVGAVHKSSFDAGATIATANTYALHRNRLEHAGIAERLEELVDIAVAEACMSRDAHGSGRVAAALGPLLATYRPDLLPPVDEATRQYGLLVGRMKDRVDLFLIETVSSVLEAEGALSGCEGCGKPVWLSLTVMDDDGTRLRSGEGLDAIGPIVDRFKPDALLINCSRPEAIPAALDVLKQFGLPFGAYANGFTGISDGFLKDAPTVDALTQRTDLGPAQYANHAMDWVDQGATIVGGCCEVGPEHISELAHRLRKAGHDIV